MKNYISRNKGSTERKTKYKHKSKKSKWSKWLFVALFILFVCFCFLIFFIIILSCWRGESRKVRGVFVSYEYKFIGYAEDGNNLI